MLLDLQNLFSDGQTLAVGAGTVVSTNIIDLGVVGTIPGGLVGAPVDDTGRDFWLELWAQITTTFTSGGAATIQCQFCQSANSDLSVPDVLTQTDVIPKATLVAGYQFRVAAVPGITKRYIGMQYVIGTAAGTGGNVSAGTIPRGGRQANFSVG